MTMKPVSPKTALGFWRLSRRHALGLCAASGGLAFLGVQASAAVSVADARAFVAATAEELFSIARSGRSVDEQRSAFRAVLERRVAIDAIARACLGIAWRSADGTQKKSYLDAFKHYVAYKYGGRFDEFRNAKLEITNARDFGERGVIVESRGTLGNGETAVVEWGVSDRSGTVLISNIVVEGLSLVTSERELIGGMLERNRGNLDGLITDLKATS
ncbi:MAG: ABC transporter substrate-binding protein [Pseudomonadota bacterium]